MSPTFETARTLALALPHVEAATRYDGSRVLKAGGCFMAGLAMHPTAEPETLVVRIGLQERAWLLEGAPEIYCIIDYHERHPVVLVRLSRIDREALRDLLRISWQVTMAKAHPTLRKRRRSR